MRVSPADAMPSESTSTPGAAVGPFTRVVAWCRRCTGAWRAARRRAADRRLMQAMNAHELRDLGIGRGEARHWADAPPVERRR
ncbi:DUF1127 domain-containing protein [Aquincola sp. MAHUQ-54]|uniref:DUF1127 domain-containing protein n=1 Tax=Aquincola agrisoli TaxID=3119538 RepID=A0AAW9Q2X4_9BURK